MTTATQAPGFYRFSVGDIEVTAVNDGYNERPIEGFVRNASVAEVGGVISAMRHRAGHVRVPYTSLVLRTAGKTVLIDTSNGDMGPPTSGTWLANFRAAGFDPTAVDTVLLTHLHGDHINGIRLKSGAAVFPNAEIMMPAAEWDFWMSDARMAAAPDAAKPAFQNVRRVFAPLAADVNRFADGASPVAGVTAIAAHGHSPGHTCYAIQSGAARLMMMADITNHPGLFLRHPEWQVMFDMDADAAMKSRRRMADLAVAENMQVSFFHAPFPATGYIDRRGSGYELVPVQWS
jgi:glyoxylase-like metal-dependent hydrolase (beta-lactamase superfamily II)